MAVDQTEAMIAAIKAQLEKERAAEAAKKKKRRGRRVSQKWRQEERGRDYKKPTQNFVQRGVRAN